MGKGRFNTIVNSTYKSLAAFYLAQRSQALNDLRQNVKIAKHGNFYASATGGEKL